jgi:hypothetical protein
VKAKRSYDEIAASRAMMRGALAAVITEGERLPRTLPRQEVSRRMLSDLGERPERIGPRRK